MAEINKIPGHNLPLGEQPIQKPNEAAQKIPPRVPPEQSGENAVGRDGSGQPIGVAPSTSITQNELMSEVVTGRDLSQLAAAEHLRANGGVSATDVLLGLNQQPSMLGGLLAPPGNLEALRHLTPTTRRKILRDLLSKQKNQMRRLVAVARDDEQHQQQEEHPPENEDSESAAIENVADALGFHNQRVYRELAATTKMLDQLDEFLNMQDYTLSQIGSFSAG